MKRTRTKIDTVMGHRIAPPRLTGWGKAYLLLYGAGPILAVLAALDLAGFLFFWLVLDRCYGIFCLL